MNRKRIVTAQSLQDEVPCELTYTTTKREVREILAERDRFMRIISDQGVWIVAFLRRFCEYPGTARHVEFTPEEMEVAAERLSAGPLHVARSRDGGLRLSLEPFHELAGNGAAVGGDGAGVEGMEEAAGEAEAGGDGESAAVSGAVLGELNDADVRPPGERGEDGADS